MKASGAPDVGDLVRANLDIANGFDNAIGLVVEFRGVMLCAMELCIEPQRMVEA